MTKKKNPNYIQHTTDSMHTARVGKDFKVLWGWIAIEILLMPAG